MKYAIMLVLFCGCAAPTLSADPWATATPNVWVSAAKTVAPAKTVCPCGCGCKDCSPGAPCDCGCPCGLPAGTFKDATGAIRDARGNTYRKVAGVWECTNVGDGQTHRSVDGKWVKVQQAETPRVMAMAVCRS